MGVGQWKYEFGSAVGDGYVDVWVHGWLARKLFVLGNIGCIMNVTPSPPRLKFR